MTDPDDGWPPRPGRHAMACGGQRSPHVRYRWYGALLAGVAAAAVATSAIILTNSHDRRPASGDCGMVSCSAPLPGNTGAVAQGSSRGELTAQPTPAHHSPAHAPSPAPSATAAPAPSPSASPTPPASHHAHAHPHAGGHHAHGHG